MALGSVWSPWDPKATRRFAKSGGGGPAFSEGVKGSQRWIHFHFQTFGIIAIFLYWDPQNCWA